MSVGTISLRFTGSIDALGAATTREWIERRVERRDAVRDAVAAILARVRRDGDAALVALARELDGVMLESLEVPIAETRRALDGLDPAVRRAMERAARNLTTAHRAFAPRAVEVETETGVLVGRRPDPFARAGVYAPGGRAAYPSSVLMTAIPARVAGVSEIVLCSPPGASGRPSAAILAAAAIAGVDRVFALGGAGAIAAMAFGTESVPRADVIAGPGNAYVAEAKLQVRDRVAIDSPAGPSELIVIADASADPLRVAREMLAQAEHDPEAWSLAIALDEGTAARVAERLAESIDAEPRAAVIRASLAARGGVLTARGLDEALRLANEIAPEHLLLAIADPEAALARTRNAGAVFLGGSSSVTFGDYLTGANHTLPTSGAARIHSGLSTGDFVRWTSWQRVTPDAAARLAGDVASFALAEGLDAHAAAARAWESGR
jgi:histidinol dehydrogenase